MLVKELGEFGLIKRLAAGIVSAGRPVIAGIGDDCAAIHPPEGKVQLVTTDMLVEDVHFRTSTATPFQIGWKSLAVNVSDIAAMGGEPTYAFVSIGLPRDAKVEFVDELYSGMSKMAEACSVDIVGGDTVSAPQVIVNIVLLGEVEAENLVLRSGARIGDALVVTGELGGSDAGLAILEHDLPIEGKERHLMPAPRVREGRLLARSGYVTSMIDISDGLASEVHHICEMSGTGAEVYMDKIPLADNVQKVAENYELLFTCKPDKVPLLSEEMQKECVTSLTTVGRIVDISNSIIIEDESGRSVSLTPRGYNHFTSAI